MNQVSKVSSRSANSSENPWKQVAADAVFWFVLVVMFVAFRAAMIWFFRSQLSPSSGPPALLRCFTTCLRFDMAAATYAVIPTMLLSVAAFFRPLGHWHGRVRLATIMLALAACGLVFVSDATYFAEYQNQFDHWVFGLVHDDRSAIFQTIWKSYPIIRLALALLAFVTGGTFVAGKLCERVGECVGGCFPFAPRHAAAWMPIVLSGLIVFGARGSLGRRPMQLKDAATTGDALLNKWVLNPFFALKHAVQQHRLIQTAGGLHEILPDENIETAAHAAFPLATNAVNLDDFLRQTARGAAGPKPSHIFLVVMESYDAWPMQPGFAHLGLSTRLNELAREGIGVKAFVSAAGGTMDSLAAIITGLPHAGVHANYQPGLRQSIPTSIAPIFKRLGYKTRFFCSGYLSWQRLGDFCREQGFDEVFGGDQMSARLTGNEWGVDDEVLFNFVLSRATDEPTFDMIMSTSYHPPFSVDLKAKGWPAAPAANADLEKLFGRETARMYGHLWYSDRCLGEFVTAAERRLERPVFAITGDHFSRRFPTDQRPTTFQRKAVPLVLYGRKALAQISPPSGMAGSHLDIVPTLVNLAAPREFLFHAVGHDLLDAPQPQLGFGADAIVGANFILENSASAIIEDLDGKPAQAPSSAEALQRQFRRLQALGWWRSLKGSELVARSGTQTNGAK